LIVLKEAKIIISNELNRFPKYSKANWEFYNISNKDLNFSFDFKSSNNQI